MGTKGKVNMYGFIMAFEGIWRQGYAFVAASTPEEAQALCSVALSGHAVLGNYVRRIHEVTEVCTLEKGSKERFVLVDDGDE